MVSQRIGEVISLSGESDQEISPFEFIPREFFEDMESSWKGRVKRIHAEEAFAEVERAAKALSVAVGFGSINVFLFQYTFLSFLYQALCIYVYI